MNISQVYTRLTPILNFTKNSSILVEKGKLARVVDLHVHHWLFRVFHRNIIPIHNQESVMRSNRVLLCRFYRCG